MDNFFNKEGMGLIGNSSNFQEVIQLKKIIKRKKIRILNKEYSNYRKFMKNKKYKSKRFNYENSISNHNSNSKVQLTKIQKKSMNSTKFEIRKSKQEFDPSVNYYIEYWKMFNENEYILAKIKENLYEINTMKGHLQELNSLNGNI